MPYSSETNSNSHNSLAKTSFRLSSVNAEFANRNRTAGEIVPVSTGVDDGRQTELIFGLSPRLTTPKSNRNYEVTTKAIDTDNAEIAASLLYESYQMTHGDDEAFMQPASVIINKEGEISWSADVTNGTSGLVLVRGSKFHGKKSIQHLGEDEKYGVITDITAKDMLYLAPNALINAMKDTDRLDRDRLSQAFIDAEDLSEMMRFRFNEAVRDDMSAKSNIIDRAQRNKRKKRNQQSGETPNYTTTQTSMDEEELRAHSATTKGFTVTDNRHSKVLGKELELYQGATTEDESSLGFSEMVRLEMEKDEAAEKKRLAARVEKYTEKVATYEEIAADALARRMKGRLFNPLTRRNKEAVKKDDLNMHLLEGFSRALDGAMMKQWLADGYSDEAAAEMIYEHQQTRQEARAARNHEELRKGKLGSFLDKYANMSKGKKIGVAIGAAAAFGVIGLAGAAAGGVLAAGGGVALAGAKVGKTYLQHRSKIYETGRDESRQSPEVSVSVANGRAETRTATQQVFAGMEHDEKRREKAIQKADRNKKVAAGLAAISAVAIGAGVAMKVAEHSDDIQKFWSRPLETGIADESLVTEPSMSTPEPIPTPAPAEFSVDASTVINGEGWYQTIQEVTGPITPAEQAAILQKIGPALQEKGWAYPMTDGTWGISRPGALPKDVLELIKNSR